MKPERRGKAPRRRLIYACCAAAVVVAAGVVYYVFDPSEAGWMPRCLWKTLTGWDCPGCGSQRMAHALLHGDFAAAWHANAFALCLLPLLITYLYLELAHPRHPRLYAGLHHPLVAPLLAVAVTLWTILRNF